jgi:hypothetical protein
MRATIGTFKSLTVISILLLAGSSAFAQSSSDLRARYGAPSEAYEVRPHILMTVLFGADGQACEMEIEPHHTSKMGFYGSDSLMSLSTAEDVLSEVVPVENRGNGGRAITFSGGCSSVTSYDYENVTIYLSELCQPGGGKAIEAIKIEWKHRKCESKNQANSYSQPNNPLQRARIRMKLEI